jgi:ABC-type taurine transport system ATPase subunit
VKLPTPDSAQATFVLKAPDGSEEETGWEDGRTVANIGRFSVLDSACSLTYVRGGALAVGPAGIDVPRRFAEALDTVKRHIGRLAEQALPDRTRIQQLENDTAAGRFVRGLSSATTESALQAMATWTSKDAQDLEDLERNIAQAKAQKPSIVRAQLQARLKAILSIGKRLAQWVAAVADSNAQECLTAVNTFRAAEIALQSVQSLGDAEVSSEVLQGEVWIALLSAASRYVASLPTRSDAPGAMSVDGRCPLCWQSLSDDAHARVRRFRQHLQGTALKNRQEAAARVDKLITAVRSLPDAIAPEDEALLATEAGLAEHVAVLMRTLQARRDVLLELLENRNRERSPVAFTSIDETSLQVLRELYTATQKRLSALPATDPEADDHIRQMERALLELTSRRTVNASLDRLNDFVAGLRAHQRLKTAHGVINTRAASSQAAALYARHMTDRYAALVDEELSGLRFRRRRPTLAQRTSKAKVEVTPLVSPELKHIPAEKVFSEGERTAIALACFLAELRLGDDSSGLIFDDPVSSLDHGIREHVARRLVAAAKERQVIVFTHDLAFLADLREQAKKIQSVDCEFRTLVATDYNAGFVENEEPFGARAVKKRIRALNQLLVDAERSAKAGDVNGVHSYGRDFYERLRSTWERFIEERLFATVVQRLERNVMPGALSKVAYTKELAEKVHEGWRRCSNAIEAHDHAPAAGGHSYSVEEMKTDLQTLIEVDKAAPSRS